MLILKMEFLDSSNTTEILDGTSSVHLIQAASTIQVYQGGVISTEYPVKNILKAEIIDTDSPSYYRDIIYETGEEDYVTWLFDKKDEMIESLRKSLGLNTTLDWCEQITEKVHNIVRNMQERARNFGNIYYGRNSCELLKKIIDKDFKQYHEVVSYLNTLERDAEYGN